jgi:hypothetical protein
MCRQCGADAGTQQREQRGSDSFSTIPCADERVLGAAIDGRAKSEPRAGANACTDESVLASVALPLDPHAQDVLFVQSRAVAEYEGAIAYFLQGATVSFAAAE